jgi:hypothetical protein
MANSPADRTSLAPQPARDSEEEKASAHAEKARQGLLSATAGLAVLKQVSLSLVDLATSFSELTSALSDLTVNTAGHATSAGLDGRRFLPLVEQLAALTKDSAVGARDIQSRMQAWQAGVEGVNAETLRAQADLNHLWALIRAWQERVRQNTSTSEESLKRTEENWMAVAKRRPTVKN